MVPILALGGHESMFSFFFFFFFFIIILLFSFTRLGFLSLPLPLPAAFYRTGRCCRSSSVSSTFLFFSSSVSDELRYMHVHTHVVEKRE